MDPRAEARITYCPQYLHVDFGSSNCLELSEMYRSFARACIGGQVNSALLEAGDNDPEGHRRLRDAFSEIAGAAAIAPDFKLALVPSTFAIRAVYRETQQALRAVGLNAWVFDTVGEAVDWLHGRVTGPMTS